MKMHVHYWGLWLHWLTTCRWSGVLTAPMTVNVIEIGTDYFTVRRLVGDQRCWMCQKKMYALNGVGLENYYSFWNELNRDNNNAMWIAFRDAYLQRECLYTYTCINHPELLAKFLNRFWSWRFCFFIYFKWIRIVLQPGKCWELLIITYESDVRWWAASKLPSYILPNCGHMSLVKITISQRWNRDWRTSYAMIHSDLPSFDV